jgi:hypothetical protein
MRLFKIGNVRREKDNRKWMESNDLTVTAWRMIAIDDYPVADSPNVSA